jgi:4-pyridoxate dehydrogenase
MGKQKAYDYVIVGAGSAGCVLANRLTENPDTNVLVLEAGGWDRDPWIHIPLGWGRILQHRLHDWGYESGPEPNLDRRLVECMRGKVIGGSSSINAMAYVRGHRSDYDRWGASGLKEWSYAGVLPYFRKQESWEGGPDAYRGGDGPLATRLSRFSDPLVDAWLAAGERAGFPSTPDYNGARQEGFGRLQVTIRQGRRASGATSYLRPALSRPNLSIETEALATQVTFDGHSANGVEYIKHGVPHRTRAQREVILASGAINTPQLLMLSGIGDPRVLARNDVKVRVPLGGVGHNLQDHITTSLGYSRKTRGAFQRQMRVDRIGIALLQAWLFGTGFATDLPSGFTAFIKTDLARVIPDVQLLFFAGSLDATPYLPPFKPGFIDSFSCRAVLLRPESRGQVSLTSNDPVAPPRIVQNFLSTEGDWRTLRAGVSLVRDVARLPPLAPFIGGELNPGKAATNQSDINAHIRQSAITAHHPVGTCKMGATSDPERVVDEELRVLGVQNLRVVDASVMPDLVGGNVNAAVVMIAEKASDLIRGRPVLKPADGSHSPAASFS